MQEKNLACYAHYSKVSLCSFDEHVDGKGVSSGRTRGLMRLCKVTSHHEVVFGIKSMSTHMNLIPGEVHRTKVK